MKIENEQVIKPRISFSLKSNIFEIEIETKNLYIRSYRDEEFENCVLLYGDPVITRYFDYGKPRSRFEIQEYINEKNDRYLKNREPFGIFSIYDKSNLKFIGQVDLAPTNEPGELEIGCILFKQYQDQGVGTEAVKALMFDYVEELNHRGIKCNDLPITKIMGTVHPQNYLSRSLIKKFGMTFDKFQERFGNPRLWYSLTVKNKRNECLQNIETSTQNAQLEEYDHNTSIQTEIASKILEIYKFNGDEKVLNVGCRDGDITAQIASHLISGSILAINISSDAIDCARRNFPENYSNLGFFLKDPLQLDYDEEFNVIFSSFILPWIPDHDSFLQAVYKSLRPLGVFVATFPLGIPPILEQSIKEIASLQVWAPYFFKSDQKWCSPNEEEFKRLLSINKLDKIHLAKIFQKKVFPCRESFEKYIFQWFKYLDVLPKDLKSSFFKQVTDRYLEIEPLLEDKKVSFQFYRLDVVAMKTTF
jgi:trans-aconitate 2-methyltransferase